MKLSSSFFRLFVCLLAVLAALPAFAQYTDSATFNDLGGAQEFARRRQELAKQLKTGYLILFARIVTPEANHYREDNDFFYYTGLGDPGAVMLMDVERGAAMIFEPEQSARVKQVYGGNLLSLSDEQKEKLGYKTVLPLSTLDGFLAYALGKETDLWLRLTYPDKADGARFEVGRDYAEQSITRTAIPLPATARPSSGWRNTIRRRTSATQLPSSTPCVILRLRRRSPCCGAMAI